MKNIILFLGLLLYTSFSSATCLLEFEGFKPRKSIFFGTLSKPVDDAPRGKVFIQPEKIQNISFNNDYKYITFRFGYFTRVTIPMTEKNMELINIYFSKDNVCTVDN